MDALQLKVVVCPLCAKAIRYNPEEVDADTAFARHTASGCDPQNYGKVHSKPRCPVPGCKERLTATNTYECRDCGTQVCLSKHRYNPKDHACVGLPVPGPTAAAKQQLGSLLRALRMNDAAAAVTKPAAAPAARSAAAPRQPAAGRASAAAGGASGGGGGGGGFFSRAAATIQGWRTSAAAATPEWTSLGRSSGARQQQQQQQQEQERLQQQAQQSQQQRQSSPSAAAAAPMQYQQLSGRAPVEVCADCGRCFDTVGELIRHAEAAHAC